MNLDEYAKLANRTLAPTDPVEGRLKGPDTVNLLHAAIGLQTEAAEFSDALKKHLFYSQPLDIVNLREELGDMMWYWILACDVTGGDPEAILARNIEKLRQRFPEKFTEAKAETRDLGAERRILEAQ